MAAQQIRRRTLCRSNRIAYMDSYVRRDKSNAGQLGHELHRLKRAQALEGRDGADGRNPGGLYGMTCMPMGKTLPREVVFQSPFHWLRGQTRQNVFTGGV